MNKIFCGNALKSFSNNNEECPVNYYTSIDPILTVALYEGGNAEGWITVQVKKMITHPKWHTKWTTKVPAESGFHFNKVHIGLRAK